MNGTFQKIRKIGILLIGLPTFHHFVQEKIGEIVHCADTAAIAIIDELGTKMRFDI